MPFRQFQVLLNAGFRLRAREQMMAINAASFPHMDEKGRAKTVAGLDQQTGAETPEEAGTTGGDIGGLRAYAMLDGARHPRPVKHHTSAPDAAREVETE